MQDYRDGFMSILFIECGALHEEFPDFPACCPNCHGEDNKATHKIYVRPIGKDGLNADWYLCTEAIVCCQLYHAVRALPYEWWVKKATEAGVKRDDMLGYRYTDSIEKNTERPHVAQASSHQTASIKAYKKEKARQAIASDNEKERTGGLRGWLK